LLGHLPSLFSLTFLYAYPSPSILSFIIIKSHIKRRGEEGRGRGGEALR
jgi:hypothetical protein